MPEIGNHLRAELRFEGFREIDSRKEVLAVLLRDGETEPAANPVNHHLAAVELHLERNLAVVEPDPLFDRRYTIRQPVKAGDVIDRKIFPSADFDDFPIGGREHTSRQSEEGEEGEEEFSPGQHLARVWIKGCRTATEITTCRKKSPREQVRIQAGLRNRLVCQQNQRNNRWPPERRS